MEGLIPRVSYITVSCIDFGSSTGSMWVTIEVLGTRLFYPGFDLIRHLVPVGDCPFAGDQHMQRDIIDRSSLAGAQGMVAQPLRLV